MRFRSIVSQSGSQQTGRTANAPIAWGDRLMRGVILGAGAVTLALLAWGHLGLGAWLMPPAPTAARQVATTSQYQVTLQMDSGQLTARGPNTLSLIVHDRDGQALSLAQAVSVSAQATMTTMAMEAPPITFTNVGGGRFTGHPLFGMAGDWRLVVTIAQPGQPHQQVTFLVSVRWS